MENLILSVFAFALAGLIAGESEQIMNNLGHFGLHNGTWFPNWKWWNANNWKYENPVIQWLMRYPLSFLKDGYHFTTSTYRVLIMIGAAIYFSVEPEQIALITFVGYVTFGIFFNVSYHK